MKRSNPNLKYLPARRRMNLNETRYWPVVKVALALLACAALVLLAALLLRQYRVRANPAAQDSAAPALLQTPPQAAPSPTEERPVSESLQAAEPQTVLLASSADAEALADPFAFNGKILFAAGADPTRLTKLLRVDPATGDAETIPVPAEHGFVRVPCEDDAFLVYFDAKADGGGTVRARNQATGAVSALCEVASGVPMFALESPYLALTERVSANASRLSVWDLTTGETVTLAMLTDPAYASSAPALSDGTVYYATPGENGASVLQAVSLLDGATEASAPGTFVHDPKASGDLLAWMTGSHGPDSDLYLRAGGREPLRIARGVVAFATTPGCVAYCRDETIFAVASDSGRAFVLSGAGTKAQLACAGGGLIVWRDLTDPDQSLWKYVRLG